jgi:hypothetical protein
LKDPDSVPMEMPRAEVAPVAGRFTADGTFARAGPIGLPCTLSVRPLTPLWAGNVMGAVFPSSVCIRPLMPH